MPTAAPECLALQMDLRPARHNPGGGIMNVVDGALRRGVQYGNIQPKGSACRQGCRFAQEAIRMGTRAHPAPLLTAQSQKNARGAPRGKRCRSAKADTGHCRPEAPRAGQRLGRQALHGLGPGTEHHLLRRVTTIQIASMNGKPSSEKR